MTLPTSMLICIVVLAGSVPSRDASLIQRKVDEKAKISDSISIKNIDVLDLSHRWKALFPIRSDLNSARVTFLSKTLA
jgi:hypothetical protein